MIDSCYLDNEPGIEKRFVKNKKGELLAIIKPLTKLDKLELSMKANASGLNAIEDIIPKMIFEWASSKDINVDNLRTFSKENQDLIVDAIIEETNAGSDRYQKNLEQQSMQDSLPKNTESSEKTQ